VKICVAQTRPVKGDIQTNIEGHKRLIDLAIANGADTIIFPELSITGYEPALSKVLATTPDDNRFDDFQHISDEKHITIGVGMPLKNGEAISIAMIIFQPNKARGIYYKQHLHEDELPYFIEGQGQAPLAKNKTALAICYELSVPEHSENASKDGAEIYIASVAKSVSGVEKAINTLSDIARKYSMTVLMANCIGYCDNFECGGKTSIWNRKGVLAGQLNDRSEGILIIDTETQQVLERTV
jgi:predicted amidohydrolase